MSVPRIVGILFTLLPSDMLNAAVGITVERGAFRVKRSTAFAPLLIEFLRLNIGS